MSQAQAACCTCASLLAALPRVCSSSEKPLPDDRRLQCCGRTICGECIHKNPRFRSYCPYCQTSAEPRLNRRPDARRGRNTEGSGAEGSDIGPDSESETDNDPPPYSAIAQTINIKFNPTESARPPPPYTPALSTSQQPGNPKDQHSSSPSSASSSSTPSPTPYTVHHLRHPPHPTPDSLLSLSLQYGIPPAILRQHNRLPTDADYLLAARHTLLIPTAHITTNPKPNPKSTATTPGTTTSISNNNNTEATASLSPRPIEDAAERERKIAIRRFMVACKESDYDTAVVYLEETGFDFAEAVQRHREDAEWEARNPVGLRSSAGARVGGKYYRGRAARVGKGKGMLVMGKGEEEGGVGDGKKAGEGKSNSGGTGGGGGFLGWWRG